MDENLNIIRPKQGIGSGKGSNMKSPTGGKGKTNNPAGRPKGTGNKVSTKNLFKSLEKAIGIPFEDQLAINYFNAIKAEDRSTILAYDRMFINKLIADAKPDEDKPEDQPLPWNGD
jgi:hypothetical protein